MASNPASMIAQALTMYKSLVNQIPKSDDQETSAVNVTGKDIQKGLKTDHAQQHSKQRNQATPLNQYFLFRVQQGAIVAS